MVAAPVDVYTGAHSLQHTFLSFFGGQNNSIRGQYNSSALVNGSMSIGWGHNFEKRLENYECEILVNSSPSAYTNMQQRIILTYIPVQPKVRMDIY